MRKAIVGLLMATTLITPALAQWQGQPPTDRPGVPSRGAVNNDRRELGQDRRELRDDGREVARDRREVNGDYRRGDYREARQDQRDLRGDRRDFRNDRQDFRGDRQDLHGDRRDYRDDRRGPPSAGFGGPGSRSGDRRYGNHRYDGQRHDERSNGGWNHDWRGDRRYDWQGYRAANRGFYHQPRYQSPRGYSYRSYAVGYRIAPLFYTQRYWISDPYAYRLPPAYGSYRWVRYYDDVLLIDLRTGRVVDVINRFFW